MYILNFKFLQVLLISAIVTLEAKGNVSVQFQKFLVQARLTGSSPETATGRFLPGTNYTIHKCRSSQVIDLQ